MSKKSYVELQRELAEILARFERSEHEDVDVLLKDYETGAAIIAELEAYLKHAEVTIKKVKKV
jgi:exonuclease VII small subunit